MLNRKIEWRSIKEPETQDRILKIIFEQAPLLGIAETNAMIGLSRTRYKQWRRDRRQCQLAKKSVGKCPNRYPNQLTIQEIEKMKNFITNPMFAHFSISSLSLHAKRTGELFSTRHTWYKYIRENQWRRPFVRKKKPYKIGIRAQAINQIWHVDVSEWEYAPGKKAYIQAVIDNFSCFVLAVNITTNISSLNTVAILKMAVQQSQRDSRLSIILLSDGGSENKNKVVRDFLLSQENFEQAIARVNIRFSNAGSEVFFRSLKSNFLRCNDFCGFEQLIDNIHFYVDQYNRVVPHNRHKGGTPYEMYCGQWNDIDAERLQEESKLAQSARRAENAKTSCNACISIAA